MSELISGKDAVLALLEGKDLLWKKTEWEDDEKEPVHKSMWNIEELLTGKTVGGEVVEFYLKPRTITINGVEYIDKQGAYEAFMEVYNEMDIHPDI